MADQSWKNLIDIMQYLSFKHGDKTNLQKVIEDAEGIDLEKYLSEARKNLPQPLTRQKQLWTMQTLCRRKWTVHGMIF